jgi:membrane protease subunit HflK
MIMEPKDVSTQKPEVTENSLMEAEEKAKEKTGPPWLYWMQRLKMIINKIFQLLGILTQKTRNVYVSMFKTEGDPSPIEDIKGAFRHISLRKKGLGFILFGFIITVYLLSGVYTVKPGEEAVARIFGKEVRHAITEGLHYHLPWPIEAIEKVNIMEVRRIDVGTSFSDKPLLFPKNRSFSPSNAGEGHKGHGTPYVNSEIPPPSPVSEKNQFFTGDENILEIKMNIQYRIKDTSDYLFNVNSPDSLISSSARAAVTEIFGGMRVDNLLTVAKAQIQKRIGRETQRMLDEYRTGLYIINITLQEVNPPKEVAQAFRDVASAKEKREEKINKAQGYWNAVIPEARGEAHKIISDAEGYMEEVINRASGDAGKFSAMLTEYRRAKDVTESRLYLETIEKILSKAKKFVVDSNKETVNLKFVK